METRRRVLLTAALLTASLAFAADAPQRVVALVPLGPVKRAFLDRVAQEIQARLDVQVRLEPQRELPPEAFYKPRKRWRAEKFLEALDANPPSGAWKVVGVTEAEISTTKWAALADRAVWCPRSSTRSTASPKRCCCAGWALLKQQP